MTGTDRWAVLMLILALSVLLGVGGSEYLLTRDRKALAALVAEEETLKTKVETLKLREAIVKRDSPKLAQWESELLPADGGNMYAQLLLDVVRAQRTSGADTQVLTFASMGPFGSFGRFAVNLSVTGQEEQVFEFIRLMERGPYRVRVAPVTYRSDGGIGPLTLPSGDAPVVIPPGGSATVGISLIYTAEVRPDK